MTTHQDNTIFKRFGRLGCMAQWLWGVALFFAIGMLVSLFNGEIGLALQAVIVMLLLAAGAIYARTENRGRRTEK